MDAERSVAFRRGALDPARPAPSGADPLPARDAPSLVSDSSGERSGPASPAPLVPRDESGDPATLSHHVPAVVVMAVLLGVFVARPLLVGTWPLMALFAVLLLVGLAWPVPADQGRGSVVVALSIGVGAFALGRLLGWGRTPLPLRLGYLLEVTFAAVAEELFFRRFVYAVLRPAGAAFAVGGSTVLFAVAHVTVYGWWVLPLDLAAGLVLGWQRWATGSWKVPAVTHVIANVLVVL